MSPTSTFGGVQRELQLRYQLYNGNWWLYVNGQWIGDYPASLYSTTGLRSQASEIHFYGEIADDVTQPGQTKTDMGSGVLPIAAGFFGSVAYMRNLRYQSTPAGAMARYNPQSWSSDLAFGYGASADFKSNNSWQSQFWWGGPGGL